MNPGSTKYYNPADAKDEDMQIGFGRPKWFTRFNFTSAIYEVPYGKIVWCPLSLYSASRTLFEGYITPVDWETAEVERDSSKLNPFISCDIILPSRFALAFKKDLDVGFIALDQERIGETVCDGMYTDMGDDLLLHKNGKPAYLDDEKKPLLHPNIMRFLLDTNIDI
jgi:hypothetical protein